MRLSFLRIALIAVPGLLLLGTLSGVLSGSGDNSWYRSLEKAPYNPPDWAFGAVWPVLYIMQGLALALVIHAGGARNRRRALIAFGVQFALNLLWSPVFFGAHQARAALYLIAAIFGVALATTFQFARIRPAAGALMVPYLAWLAFAAALNLEIVERNPQVASVAADMEGRG